MGDSYISGEGGRWAGNGGGLMAGSRGTDRGVGVYTVKNYLDQTQDTSYQTAPGAACDRSDTAEILSAAIPALPNARRVNLACSGATTDHILGQSFKGEPAQIAQLDTVLRLNRVKMIVVSIGGNDIDFSGIIERCAKAYSAPGYSPCAPVLRDSAKNALAALPQKVSNTLGAIQAMMAFHGYLSSDYRLVLQSYPRPLPGLLTDYRMTEQENRGSTGGCPFLDADSFWATGTVLSGLTDRLRDAANAQGATFLDLSTAFAGHELCHRSASPSTTDAGVADYRAEWIRWIPNPLDTGQGALQEAIHPNAYGQRALGRCLSLLSERILSPRATGWGYRCNPSAEQRPPTEMSLTPLDGTDIAPVGDPPFNDGDRVSLRTNFPQTGTTPPPARYVTADAALISDTPARHETFRPFHQPPGQTHWPVPRISSEQSWGIYRNALGGWGLTGLEGHLSVDPGTGTLLNERVPTNRPNDERFSWQFRAVPGGGHRITHQMEPADPAVLPAQRPVGCLEATVENGANLLRVLPCNGSPQQVWTIETTVGLPCTGTGTATGTASTAALTVSASTASPCPSPPVADAPDGSLIMSLAFLQRTMDKHVVNGLGVPRSYTGGHFADTRFGPDGFEPSFTYDNSVIIAALLQGRFRDVGRAMRLGDSLLYAQAHDTEPDGRIRASYMPNPLVTAAGTPYVGSFSVYTGHMAWAGMAFSRLYWVTGEQRYLDGALKVANWIQNNAADTRGLGGYIGGYADTAGDGTGMVRRTWKATEHNIDVGAFFAMLSRILPSDQVWSQRSQNAFDFVRGMRAAGGWLWTGTGLDGVTLNTDSAPEDVQTWSYLATLDPSYSPAVSWASTNLAAADMHFRGVSFARVDTSKVWFEGTAHLLAALHVRRAPGDDVRAAELQKTLEDAQAAPPNTSVENGLGIPAASSDGLQTGEGDQYYASLHTGATAWYILAGQGANPFRL
ncbi:GDSL-type esterase/lipase family protein [Kitasatospora sp. NPDC057692]|uniref:GDSL-type esterase/lipase family protein n=1 Tax=Kitasatospora sp. NPDC057692 TaxID=3346215 RepID=UPI0036AA45B4